MLPGARAEVEQVGPVSQESPHARIGAGFLFGGQQASNHGSPNGVFTQTDALLVDVVALAFPNDRVVFVRRDEATQPLNVVRAWFPKESHLSGACVIQCFESGNDNPN